MEVDPTSAVKQVLAAWRSLPEVKDLESTYLQILAGELREAGHFQAAEEVQAWIARSLA